MGLFTASESCCTQCDCETSDREQAHGPAALCLHNLVRHMAVFAFFYTLHVCSVLVYGGTTSSGMGAGAGGLGQSSVLEGSVRMLAGESAQYEEHMAVTEMLPCLLCCWRCCCCCCVVVCLVQALGRATEGFSGSDVNTLVKDVLMQPIRILRDATHFRKVRDTSGHLTGFLAHCSAE